MESIASFSSRLFRFMLTAGLLLGVCNSVSLIDDSQDSKLSSAEHGACSSYSAHSLCSFSEKRYLQERLASAAASVVDPDIKKRVIDDNILAWLWPTPFLFVGEKKDAFGAVPPELLRLAAGIEELALAALPEGCEHNQPCPCPDCDHYVNGGWQRSYATAERPDMFSILLGLARKKLREQLDQTAVGSKNQPKKVIITDVKLNIDFHGASHHPHFTTDSHFSAIFCAAIGESDIDSNYVHFNDPRPQAAPLQLPGYLQGSLPVHWEMQPGKMVIFPSFVQRYTLANTDESPRVFVKIDMHLIEDEQDTSAVSSLDARVDQLEMQWQTPVLRFRDESIPSRLNDELRHIVLELEEQELTVSKSNKGGWQSAGNLFERQDTTLCKLCRRVLHAIFNYLQLIASPAGDGEQCHLAVDVDVSWASVNRYLHSNAPHIHPGAMVSGVYYVDVGGDNTTAVHHLDPRPAAVSLTSAIHLRNSSRVFSFVAAPGVFVIFPGWLEHYVEPHTSAGTRISISFNSRVEKQQSAFSKAWQQFHSESNKFNKHECKLWIPARHSNDCLEEH